MNDVLVEDTSERKAETVVYLFCDHSTCVRVEGFKPEVVVQLPDWWERDWLDHAEERLCDKAGILASDIDISYATRREAVGYKRRPKSYLVVRCRNLRTKRKILRRWKRWGGPQLHAKGEGEGEHIYSTVNIAIPDWLIFFRDVGGSPCGWLELYAEIATEKVSTCRRNLRANIKTVRGMTHTGISKPSILSFDIECLGDGFTFPQAYNPQDQVIVIGTVFENESGDRTERSFELGEVYETESEVLAAFSRYVVESDPDLLTGYNILGFDIPFMAKRALLMDFFDRYSNKHHEAQKQRDEEALNCDRFKEFVRRYDAAKGDDEVRQNIARMMNTLVEGRPSRSTFYPTMPPRWGLMRALDTGDKFQAARKYFGPSKQVRQVLGDFWKIGRLGRRSEFKVKRLVSNAMGVNNLGLMTCPGRGILDLYLWVKTSSFKLDDYKLDTVAREFVGDRKLPLPIRDMFRYWRSGDAVKRKKVVEYCLKDCELPLRIMEKLNVAYELVETSRICKTPLPVLLVSGQSAKVKNQFFVHGLKSGFFFGNRVFEYDGKFEGATVIDPEVGFYDKHVLVLDFASLYPSIIKQNNFCPSTLCDGPTSGAMMVRISKKKCHYFMQKTKSIAPPLLDVLLRQRREVKREMKATADDDERRILDARQKAIKISCNSVYGWFGRRRGYLSCVPVSESTTAMGRKYIEMTKRAVESNFPETHVIYGDTDSVMVLTRHSDLKRAWALGEKIGGYVNAVTFGQMSSIDLELEKSCNPFILYKKKRYIMRSYETADPKRSKVQFKGIELARRDNCGLLRGLLQDVMDVMMSGLPLPSVRSKCEIVVFGFLSKLCLDEFDSRAYWIKKTIRFDTKSKNLPHIQAALRLNDRINRGLQTNKEPVCSGQRIPYVVWYKRKGKIFERSDDPDWVAEKRLTVDRIYYLNNMIVGPLERVLQFVMPVRDLALACSTELAFQLRGSMECPETTGQTTLDGYFSCGVINKRKSVPDFVALRKKNKQSDIRSFF